MINIFACAQALFWDHLQVIACVLIFLSRVEIAKPFKSEISERYFLSTSSFHVRHWNASIPSRWPAPRGPLGWFAFSFPTHSHDEQTYTKAQPFLPIFVVVLCVSYGPNVLTLQPFIYIYIVSFGNILFYTHHTRKKKVLQSLDPKAIVDVGISRICSTLSQTPSLPTPSGSFPSQLSPCCCWTAVDDALLKSLFDRFARPLLGRKTVTGTRSNSPSYGYGHGGTYYFADVHGPHASKPTPIRTR
jgi:hypothetical protein